MTSDLPPAPAPSPPPLAAARAGVPDHGEPPKYFQVKQKIDAVLDELGPGAPLPTERVFADRFGVSRMTVRQAIRELRLEGRVQRSGRSSVAGQPKLVQPLTLASYTEGVRRQGRRPGRRPVVFEQLPATPALAAALHIPPGAPVHHLERLLLADDEQVGLESTYLSVARFPSLQAEFDPATSLYAHLRTHGTTFADADERIETVLASPREVQLIGTSPALPMLLLNRITRDHTGAPVECVRSLYRGDRFSFTAHLTEEQ
ncbi:GntR family transcriptional regulator [Kitasatospora sp. MMS16-BH015]|uniref:GntR family transcriptional regulator n=1 Tax=Kitasatospora sp. MMS16-BH015 TaxID=2018025 RepID=UPI000CA143B7|nr:GntR family transcriptional regulator [Kitasatospora sp. MMS16-BH015]AUG76894.1 GntR family transcriptional regulator [Kitasatospora sp. MMS16-BH015]